MLAAISALKGYELQANDGRIGCVKDFLFDDRTWRLRWAVVDTGTWLSSRMVMIHPSAFGPVDHGARLLPVDLAKTQIESSPDMAHDQPVSRQMQAHLYDHYSWEPDGGSGYFAGNAVGMPFPPLPVAPDFVANSGLEGRSDPESWDPHLRSIAEITGYHLEATDGRIGHVENLLIDDAAWDIRYFIADTVDWWPGAHVLLSPFAVDAIDWHARAIRLSIDRAKVKASPPWDPVEMIDELYESKLHRHYGWGSRGLEP